MSKKTASRNTLFPLSRYRKSSKIFLSFPVFSAQLPSLLIEIALLPHLPKSDFTNKQIPNDDNPDLFTDRRVDILDNGSLKIQYNRNRYYNYHTGRWLSHDPSGHILESGG
ncbi:MAG: hypothetical protein ACYS76_02730 [Planctomycetota bacterium]